MNLKPMTNEDKLLARAFSLFNKYHNEAKGNPRIHKPISWAIYKTWQIIDCLEITKGDTR